MKIGENRGGPELSTPKQRPRKESRRKGHQIHLVRAREKELARSPHKETAQQTPSLKPLFGYRMMT